MALGVLKFVPVLWVGAGQDGVEIDGRIQSGDRRAGGGQIAVNKPPAWCLVLLCTEFYQSGKGGLRHLLGILICA